MSFDWMRGRPLWRLLVAVVAVTTLVPPASGWTSTADSPGNGTIPLLVKSRVPLTEEVAASIGSHAASARRRSGARGPR